MGGLVDASRLILLGVFYRDIQPKKNIFATLALASELKGPFYNMPEESISQTSEPQLFD